MLQSVSVIIPTHNRLLWLRECLQTLVNDPWPEKEIIIVNDAGTDVSETVATLHANCPVRLIQLPANRGHVFARNEGIRMAQGDVIILCDDDDILLPGHIARVVSALQRNQTSLVYTDAEVVRYHWDGFHRNLLSREPFAYEYDPALLRQWNTVIPSGIAYARTLHERIGLFDESVYHYWDWDFFLRASALSPLIRIAQASVLYMVSDGNHNVSSDPSAMSGHLELLRQKHDLPPLPVSSFALMQSDPRLQSYKRPTQLLWDGTFPVKSSIPSTL